MGEEIEHTLDSPPLRATLPLICRLKPRLLALLPRLLLAMIPRRRAAYLLRAHRPRRLPVVRVVRWSKGLGCLFLRRGGVRERALALGEVLLSAWGVSMGVRGFYLEAGQARLTLRYRCGRVCAACHHPCSLTSRPCSPRWRAVAALPRRTRRRGCSL